MAVFGPTFGEECYAAGIGGLPFSWMPETGEIHGRENLTTEQNATLDGVIAAHDPTKPAAPYEVTNRQWFHALANQGDITQQEAMAAIKTGTVPASMQAYIDTLPEADQFDTTMILVGETTISWTSDEFKGYASYVGWTDDKIYELFLLAGSL